MPGLSFFSFPASAWGYLISSVSKTQQQSLLGAFLFLVPAIILSGFATPIANMPMVVQKLTLFNPMRYFLVILRSVFLEDATLSMCLPHYWPMALIGVATLSFAGWIFRRRLY